MVVDFEVAYAEWLEPPTSASMQHRRDLHEHGMTLNFLRHHIYTFCAVLVAFLHRVGG